MEEMKREAQITVFVGREESRGIGIVNFAAKVLESVHEICP